ncbi:cbb3-type cytochrome c oxidase N-terminal domain-containing protein [Bizionia paragorgiae]|uniref:cbb3-type cytochrome c oxidase N-terminal domain-containing protein n=1 Tax=Bizionia paragorgiae TaxID=283786 RepID=UPI00299E2464|nr:cbb3-type cytochrome c oxidase N-terminal domain-containing protein [Bizionia paragorgiae]MDX1271344.1 cbb3-type cytochrome c oxidase N-terminal domain-containing protein [Bizionia paragorgiae]
MRTTASLLRLLLLLIISIILMEWVYESDQKWAMLSEPIYWVIIGTVMLFGMAFEICVEALRVVLFKTLKPEQQASYLAKEATKKENQFKWINQIYLKMLGEEEVLDEKEIILDHDYDGIRELDNNLPPWWKYSFYATIVFAIVYMVRFEVLNDYTQDEEYEMAVAAAQLEIEEWKKTAKDLVDVNTVTLLTDAADLSAGKKIYETNCIACHKSDGGGGIGPNLTDPYWILGGSIKDIFKTVSEGGRAGKGMIAWKSELKPLEMAQVSSYVMSLGGTTPAEPKAPEGDLRQDENAPKAEVPTEETVIETEVTQVN